MIPKLFGNSVSFRFKIGDDLVGHMISVSYATGFDHYLHAVFTVTVPYETSYLDAVKYDFSSEFLIIFVAERRPER